jgi:hypothetical protein
LTSATWRHLRLAHGAARIDEDFSVFGSGDI